MKRKMEQLRNGKFEYELPRLILSQEEIYVRVKPGEKLKQELYFGTESEKKIKGYINTTNRRFVPAVEKFSGTAISLPYGIDAGGMEPGETCQGMLNLITNVGEYEIPFTIEAVREQMRTSVGEVNHLEAFVKLARNNYREAFRLFTSQSFPSILPAEDDRLLAMYQGMTRNPVTYQHLEEFLIGAGLKDPVELNLRDCSREFYGVTESIQESLCIQRSGWGHFRLEVETRGDFIQVQKRVIDQEEFIGSIYQLEFIILAPKMGRGREFGSILIKGPYGNLEYQITASRNSQVSIHMSTFEKQRKASLFTDFFQLQLHKLDFKTWYERSMETLEKMALAGCDYPIYQIYAAYVYFMNDEIDKAREILLKYQDKSFTRKDLELAGAYLYMCYQTELLQDRWALVDKLQKLYSQQEESYLLLWLLIQVDEEYKGSPLRLVTALEHQYQIGCRSPLLYLEASRLIQREINFLTKMSPFWIQVMLFMVRQGMLNEELSMRIAYLSGYAKTFSKSLYQVLTMAYMQYPALDTLEAICKMIMKDNPGRKCYFPWFERAVEQNLHLTRLYECYIESIDERYQKILPKTIRRYFVYNNALSDSKKAFVYANVVRHREEDPAIYESYQKIVHDFAFRKLKEGAMSEDYAILYQELSEHIQSEEEEEALRRVMFTHRLYCDDRKVRNVIVRQAQMLKEMVYPCVKGVAYPDIYTEDAVIIFQDSQQRRYTATVDYNLRRLFDEEMVERCGFSEDAQPGALLYHCSDKYSGGRVSAENLKAHQCLTECEAFTSDYRRKIRKRLLMYYEKNARGEEIEEYLRSLNYAEFARVDKKQLMELFIERGMLTESYRVLCEFGSEGVDSQALLKLCSRMILKEEFAMDDELLCLAAEVFDGGIYDEVILHYLMLYYVGPAETMLKLWESAKGFQMDTYRLEEKILTQLVFVEDYCKEGADVLADYVRQRGREEIILSYVTFRAYGYFIHGEAMEEYLKGLLEAIYQQEWEMDPICKVALLKLHTTHREWSSQQEQQVKKLLEECARKGLSFAFFQMLPEEFRGPYQLDDKVFAEYQGYPDSKVTLYYALDMGLGNELEYQSEPLSSLYHGYFNKTFLLFYGESLRYYFRVERGDKIENTDEKVLHAASVKEETRTRYQMINQILSARKLGRTDVVKDKLQQYKLQQKYVERLFSIEKGQAHE